MKSSAQLGFALQRAAHVAAPLVALAITLVQLVFWFGGQFRLALEERNDQLAAWWVSVLGLAPCVTENPVTASEPSHPSQPSEPLPMVVPPASKAATATAKPRKASAKRSKPAAAPKPVAAQKPRPARRARRQKIAVAAV